MAKPNLKVALVESSKSSGHAGRGIGVYTENLKKYLPRFGVELVTLNQKPDLIHYPQWEYLSADWPKLFSDTPIVATIHDVIPLEFPDHYPLGLKSRVNLIMQKSALNHAKIIITDSYASVKSIHKYLGIPHSKLKFIYLGVDPLYKPSTQKPKTKLPNKFALHIGGINWNKNLVNLTKVCLDLKLPLVIVGKEAMNIDLLDTSHAELRHIPELKKLWQNPNIIRLGYVETSELVKIMNRASVYCSVAYAEGFGLPALEAIACGTPLVASNTHSLPEICGDYATYCNPWDLNSIKSSVNHALKSRVNHAINKSRVNPKFSWEKTAAQTVDVYREVLKK